MSIACIKPRRWIASAKNDLSAMAIEVRRAVGCALFASRHDGDTFRAVYTVRFADVV